MKHRLTAAVAALALAAAACGADPAPESAGPVELTVWIMDGSVTQDLLKSFESDYEALTRASTSTSRSRRGTASASGSPPRWPAPTRRT